MKTGLLLLLFNAITPLSVVNQKIDQTLQSHGVNQQGMRGEVLAIGAPEVYRFHEFSNFLETTALELWYVKYGQNYANFSIGLFQMKPSFIEELEEIIGINPNLQSYTDLIPCRELSSRDARAFRIKNLKNINTQLRYLEAFYAYAESTYCHLWDDQDNEAKIRFISTLYNVGLTASEEFISEYMTRRNFPYGSGYEGSQWSYADISIEYFNYLKQIIC